MDTPVAAPVTQNTPPPTSQPTAPETKAPSQPAPTPPEMFEVKVNGKVVKMSRDEVLGHASMSHAAQAKFEEASKSRKQVESIISRAKSNPIEALMDPALGLTKDQIRDAFEKWYSAEYIDPETLTPEQRKLKEAESRLKKYEDDEKAKLDKEKTDQEEQLTARQREYLQGQIIEAIDKSGLPKTKFIAGRMAFYMRENLRQGWEAPIEMIVQQVKKERQAIMSDLVDSSEGDVLINMLGEGVVNKIRQHDLKQLRERRRVPTSSNGGTGPQPLQTDKVSYSDVKRNLNKMRTGKL